MSQPAVHIEQLGKRYRTAQNARRHGTLRDRLSAAARQTWRRATAAVQTESGGETSSVAVEQDEGFWALRELTFDIEAGETLGIVGRNGSGKSTLLKILARITEPTVGYAAIHGRTGSLLEVGTGFHMELSGRENVFLSGAILGMRRAEICSKFDRITAMAGVEQFLDVPVKRYSSGMYLRLAFSVAAHLDNEVLLLDEVLSVGDAEFQRTSATTIREMAASGRSVVLVSHDFEQVRRLCDRVVLLDRGQVQAIGPAAEVLGDTKLGSAA